MACKLYRMFFPAVVVLMFAGLSFGQGANTIEPPEMPTFPNDASEVSAPALGGPSIGDLMTVIDKATADGTEDRKSVV